ncbi:uncharacterized protein N7483_009542 [Penicillium malachiteum]|uniref:uncharacterized protein n=1 Tax=Penicillium malachiteum TaxID=1324776 RepID=UPI002549364B|nr:uncharacterized protein N7483_009542 [Penicillium malachiteum]KAJ5721608.1 hypothetical protein N7483_009542 [Penicillium malachiteum]
MSYPAILASTTAPEAGGGHATRRHVPHLSISDPSHHVTEAIGHMYDDDYDRNDIRRLSYISSPHAESITTIPRGPASPNSLHTSQPSSPIEGQHKQTNGHLRPPLATHRSYDRDSDPGSSELTRSPSETATSSFPLNDINYESDPAAVVQELNNLAAIRRMSMDVAAAGDPDLPSFNSNFSIPSLPPSPSADENDTSRLFWVPASLHPELAPKEFKSFLESKADLIKRKSGDYSALGPERQGSQSSLRRKRSMLSKQIDNSAGYTDGADRLEHQRSQAGKRDGMLSPNLQQLETLVDDSSATSKDTLIQGMQKASIAASEDKPILPPAPPGHSLRRSTRTQYRKGSLKKGEKPPYSKRIGRGLSESADSAPSILPSPNDAPILGSTRAPSDSAPKTRAARAGSASSRSTAYTPGSTTSSTFDSIIDQPEAEQEASQTQQDAAFNQSDVEAQASAATYARQWQSRTNSNGRSTTTVPLAEQTVPVVAEQQISDPTRTPSNASSQTSRSSERVSDRDATSSHSSKTTSPGDTTPSKRSLMGPSRQGRETTPTLNDFANNPQMIPGNSTRTDSLSFIPTIPEERRSDDRKTEGKKSKKDDGGRKSSWHWLLGSEEKEKRKEKDSDSRRAKSKISEKVHSSNSRPEAPAQQSSLDSTPKGRESLILDRLDPKLEEERRKDGVRRASGDKKEKDGIFSSIFGGGRKKHGGESHHHRKNSSRNLSPDPPVRELRADVDYPWTRFSILEERAIYRMAHIKLANPRRALYSQVLLSNFMYSYLEKVQQMHPQMVVASGSQRSSRSREREQQQQQPDEYLQYQRYQEAQEQQQQQQQHYGDSGYDDGSMYDYDDDPRDRYQAHGHSKHGYENGHSYDSGHYQYDHSSFGDDVQLDDDDDDDMW